MTKLTILLASTALLAGCATTASRRRSRRSKRPAAEMPAAETPKATIGSFGFDKAGMDSSVVPGDDFYDYANGTWAKNTPIPADKSNYGMFTYLDDISRERTKTLIEEAAKDPNSRIGAVYASFMDQATIEAKGLAPIQPWLGQIKGVKSKGELPALYAAAGRMGVGTPFGGYVGQDDKNPEEYILSLGQSGLGMPDRDYYLKADPKLAETKAKYLQHLTNVLTLAGEPNAAARAKAILDFETKIAEGSWTRIESRDATKTYNKMTLAELAKLAPGYDFTRQIRESGAQGVESLIVAQPSAITKIAALVSKAPLGVLKDQLMVRSLDTYSPYLPSRVRQGELLFLRHDPVGHAGAGSALEAGGRFHHRRAAGRRQQALRRALLSARNQGRGRPVGQQRHRRDGPPDRQARLDGARDQGQGAREARRLHAQDRLSQPVARHVRRCRSIAATRSAMRCAPTRSIMPTTSASSASRSIAGNGA